MLYLKTFTIFELILIRNEVTETMNACYALINNVPYVKDRPNISDESMNKMKEMYELCSSLKQKINAQFDEKLKILNENS